MHAQDQVLRASTRFSRQQAAGSRQQATRQPASQPARQTGKQVRESAPANPRLWDNSCLMRSATVATSSLRPEILTRTEAGEKVRSPGEPAPSCPPH